MEESLLKMTLDVIKKLGMINFILNILPISALMTTSYFATETVLDFDLKLWQWSDYSFSSLWKLIESGIPFWWAFIVAFQVALIYYLIPQLIISFGKVYYRGRFDNKDTLNVVAFHTSDQSKYKYKNKDLVYLEKKMPILTMSLVHVCFASFLLTSKANYILIPVTVLITILAFLMLFMVIPNMYKFNKLKPNNNKP